MGWTCTPVLEDEGLTTGPPEKSLCICNFYWEDDIAW